MKTIAFFSGTLFQKVPSRSFTKPPPKKKRPDHTHPGLFASPASASQAFLASSSALCRQLPGGAEAPPQLLCAREAPGGCAAPGGAPGGELLVSHFLPEKNGDLFLLLRFVFWTFGFFWGFTEDLEGPFHEMRVFILTSKQYKTIIEHNFWQLR